MREELFSINKRKCFMEIVAMSDTIFLFPVPSQLTVFIPCDPRPLWSLVSYNPRAAPHTLR